MNLFKKITEFSKKYPRLAAIFIGPAYLAIYLFFIALFQIPIYMKVGSGFLSGYLPTPMMFIHVVILITTPFWFCYLTYKRIRSGAIPSIPFFFGVFLILIYFFWIPFAYKQFEGYVKRGSEKFFQETLERKAPESFDLCNSDNGAFQDAVGYIPLRYMIPLQISGLVDGGMIFEKYTLFDLPFAYYNSDARLGSLRIVALHGSDHPRLRFLSQKFLLSFQKERSESQCKMYLIRKNIEKTGNISWCSYADRDPFWTIQDQNYCFDFDVINICEKDEKYKQRAIESGRSPDIVCYASARRKISKELCLQKVHIDTDYQGKKELNLIDFASCMNNLAIQEKNYNACVPLSEDYAHFSPELAPSISLLDSVEVAVAKYKKKKAFRDTNHHDVVSTIYNTAGDREKNTPLSSCYGGTLKPTSLQDCSIVEPFFKRLACMVTVEGSSDIPIRQADCVNLFPESIENQQMCSTYLEH